LDSILEVQVWIDCPCFGDIDSITAFTRRVNGRNIDCNGCIVSDVLLTLHRDCFTLHLTRQSLTSSPSTSSPSSSSVLIPLSYLHNPHKEAYSSVNSVEQMTNFDLFELYREEALTLFYFQRQLYRRPQSILSTIQQRYAHRTSHPTMPRHPINTFIRNKEQPNKLELVVDGCKFTALYNNVKNSKLPFECGEDGHQLPVWKVSAVFPDRTILRWDAVLKQDIEALLSDGSERIVSLGLLLNNNSQLQLPDKARDRELVQLLSQCRRLLAFFRWARTPPEHRKELEEKRRNLSFSAASALSQTSRHLRLTSQQPCGNPPTSQRSFLPESHIQPTLISDMSNAVKEAHWTSLEAIRKNNEYMNSLGEHTTC